MKEKDHYKVGTLIEDMGKIGVIYRIIEAGTLKVKHTLINWRFNYEIYYFDGGVTVMGHNTLKRLVDNGSVKVVNEKQNFVVEEIVGDTNAV